MLLFVNLSGDSATEFFSDGISEEILDALAKRSRAARHRADLVVRVQGEV